jgi:hypothetical protein
VHTASHWNNFSSCTLAIISMHLLIAIWRNHSYGVMIKYEMYMRCVLHDIIFHYLLNKIYIRIIPVSLCLNTRFLVSVKKINKWTPVQSSPPFFPLLLLQPSVTFCSLLFSLNYYSTFEIAVSDKTGAASHWTLQSLVQLKASPWLYRMTVDGTPTLKTLNELIIMAWVEHAICNI